MYDERGDSFENGSREEEGLPLVRSVRLWEDGGIVVFPRPRESMLLESNARNWTRDRHTITIFTYLYLARFVYQENTNPDTGKDPKGMTSKKKVKDLESNSGAFKVTRNIPKFDSTPVQTMKKMLKKNASVKLNGNSSAQCERKMRYTPPASAKRVFVPRYVIVCASPAKQYFSRKIYQSSASVATFYVKQTGVSLRTRELSCRSETLKLKKKEIRKTDDKAPSEEEEASAEKGKEEEEEEMKKKKIVDEDSKKCIATRPTRRSRTDMEEICASNTTFVNRISVEFSDVKKKVRAMEHIKRLVKYTFTPDETISTRIGDDAF